MLARLASLRLWLLIAMLTSAGVGLAAAAILFSHIEQSDSFSADRAKALAEARSVAAQLQAGAGLGRLVGVQSVLASDQLTVKRAGRIIFHGPVEPNRERELTVTAPFPGGVVSLTDYSSPTPNSAFELTLITGGALALVIAAAILAATLLSRSVRSPLTRAIQAADKMAHGDLSARMGASGPHELTRLGRTFDHMAERLERVDADQRQFLADVAHEIATPLHSVSGFALALADGAVNSPQQRAEARTVIHAETQRLAALIADLRELTRLDLAQAARLAPLQLKDFARELVARFRATADAAGIAIDFDARRGTVITDIRLLDSIASNLLSNAIRYTPAGGRVHVDVRKQGANFTVAVRDTGVGIAPEDQRRIFERLYRADSARDRATGGSGLGLAIAARAASALGGRIELESTINHGSEFRLIVPLDRITKHPSAQSRDRTESTAP